VSLTAFLKNNIDVRERFKHEFHKPQLQVKRELLAQPLTRNYSIIGTAFDYLLRFYIERLNPIAIDRKPWCAETALHLLRRIPVLYFKGMCIVLKAKTFKAEFLRTGQITDRLIESILSLAYLDPIYRANRGRNFIGESIDKRDIDDIRRLISIVNPEYFAAKNLCLLNPTFGIASTMVGGADADIVIDDNLIDIKTTKNLELSLRDFQQVVGYFVLQHIGGFENLNYKAEIRKISLYFSRYAYLHTLELEDIVNKNTFPDFVDWFKDRAQEAYGTL